MKILITGATGFIASQLVSTLTSAGHEIVCCVRNVPAAQQRFWYATVIACDFNIDTSPDVWVERLKEHNIEAVINCVGVLQGSIKQSIDAIHRDTPIALFKACEQLNIKRVIQLSALGAGDVDTPYSTTKNGADEFLLNAKIASALIIRPSVVHSTGSYGGTSLFRGLCALPFITPIVGDGQQLMAPIFLQDLADAIHHYIEHPEHSGKIIYAVGPEEVSQKQLLFSMRKWLGFGKSFCLSVPLFFIAIGARVGDWLERSPINMTTLKMLGHPNIYDPKPFQETLPFKVKGFTDALIANPSSTQDRWHARLYFVRPLLRFSLALMWIVSGIVPFINIPQSHALLSQIGIPSDHHNIVRVVLSSMDILIGLAILSRWRINLMGTLQSLVVLGYTAVVTISLTHEWLNPLGPIVKNLPILVAILAWTAIEDDR